MTGKPLRMRRPQAANQVGAAEKAPLRTGTHDLEIYMTNERSTSSASEQLHRSGWGCHANRNIVAIMGLRRVSWVRSEVISRHVLGKPMRVGVTELGMNRAISLKWAPSLGMPTTLQLWRRC